MLTAAGLSLILSLTGLLVAYWVDAPPGATIAALAVAAFVLVYLVSLFWCASHRAPPLHRGRRARAGARRRRLRLRRQCGWRCLARGRNDSAGGRLGAGSGRPTRQRLRGREAERRPARLRAIAVHRCRHLRGRGGLRKRRRARRLGRRARGRRRWTSRSGRARPGQHLARRRQSPAATASIRTSGTTRPWSSRRWPGFAQRSRTRIRTERQRTRATPLATRPAYARSTCASARSTARSRLGSVAW